MLVRTLSRRWLCFLLRLKVQLSIDTLSYQCRKGLVWGPEKWWEKYWKSASCHSGCVMQKSDASRRRCHWDVRKEVEAPLDIKDVIHQMSCFSKTIVMNITLPSVGGTSAFSMMYHRWLWRLFFFFFLVAIIWNMTPYSLPTLSRLPRSMSEPTFPNTHWLT